MEVSLGEWLSRDHVEILSFPHPILTAQTEPLPITPELAEVSKRMLHIMYAHRGIGLAAPQVGLPYQIFVTNPSGDSEKKDKELTFINPKIISISARTSVMLEGCLSIPDVHVEVERPLTVLFEYDTLDGKHRKGQYSGFTARVWQHEFDHLQGILITAKGNNESKG